MPLGAWRNLPGRAPRLAVDETPVSSTVDEARVTKVEARGGGPPHATPGSGAGPIVPDSPCPDPRYTSMGTDYTGF